MYKWTFIAQKSCFKIFFTDFPNFFHAFHAGKDRSEMILWCSDQGLTYIRNVSFTSIYEDDNLFYQPWVDITSYLKICRKLKGLSAKTAQLTFDEVLNSH